MNYQKHSEAVLALLSQAPGWEEMPEHKIIASTNTYRLRLMGIKDGDKNGIEVDYRIGVDEAVDVVVNSINDGSRAPCGFFNEADEAIFKASLQGLPRREKRFRLREYKKTKKKYVRR